MFRKKKPTFIIAFDATTQAMATDKFCTKNGLPGRLIPVPREITAGCGFAWKAAPEDEPKKESSGLLHIFQKFNL